MACLSIHCCKYFTQNEYFEKLNHMQVSQLFFSYIRSYNKKKYVCLGTVFLNFYRVKLTSENETTFSRFMVCFDTSYFFAKKKSYKTFLWQCHSFDNKGSSAYVNIVVAKYIEVRYLDVLGLFCVKTPMGIKWTTTCAIEFLQHV